MNYLLMILQKEESLGEVYNLKEIITNVDRWSEIFIKINKAKSAIIAIILYISYYLFIDLLPKTIDEYLTSHINN